MPPDVRLLEAATKDFSPERHRCHSVPLDHTCRLGADVTPTLAVWSDSHGVELAFALGEIAAQKGVSLVELSSSACPPSLGYSPPERTGCADHNSEVLEYLKAHANLRTVILAALAPGSDYAGQYQGAIAALENLGGHVVLEYPTPESTDNVSLPSKLARQLWMRGHFDHVLETRDDYDAQFGTTIALIDRLAKKYEATVVDPRNALCDENVCFSYLDGRVMLFDDQHPSVSAERLNAAQYTGIIVASMAVP